MHVIWAAQVKLSSISRFFRPGAAWHGAGIAIVLGLIVFRILMTPISLEPDSSRYLALGANMADYGTLAPAYEPGTPPNPGLVEAGPLTAVEIALAAWIDPATSQVLHCYATDRSLTPACKGSLRALKLIYAIEAAVFLLATYRIAYLVFGDAVRAWLAVAAVLACRELWQYSRFVLSEPLFMAVAGLALWSWLSAWKYAADKWRWCLSGLLLGLVFLVKPSWLPLGPIAAIIILLFAWRQLKPGRAGAAALIFMLGFAVPTGLFLLRNYIQFGQITISSPHYLIGSLSHRLAFNMMSWSEWLKAWIYYLPDFGDNLAVKLFGADAVAGLGWDAGSHYGYGRDVLHPSLTRLPTSEAQHHLLQNYVLNDLLKNFAVNLLLAVRGLFIGGKWGLYALISAAVVFRLMRKDQRRLWLLLLLPPLVMVGVNAQLSVSIVRYNIALIPGYALALAAAAHALGSVVAAKWKRSALRRHVE